MAAVLAGEAAIRIVPTLAGFKTEADRRLKAYKFAPISVQINPDLAKADAEMAKWRTLQERNALNISVKTDTKTLYRDLQQVEHIFKRSALSRAVRLNVKVVGLDALPALAYAAGSAASGLDALGKSAFLLPGLVGGALASVAALAVGLSGVSNALKAYSTDLSNAADHAKTINQDNRQLADSYKDYKNAVKDTTREIQDLNAENRRSSLNVADAVLSVQEAADRLREGGQKSVLELRRDQLNYLQSIDRLQQVQTQAQRTAQDATEANAKGVEGADKVVDALDKIAKNTEKLDVDKITEVDKALAKLAPSARSTVEAIHNLQPAWLRLQDSVQGNLFKDLDKDIANLGQTTLPGLEIGLSRVASGLNSNFRSIFQSIGKGGNQTLLSKIFGNTDGGLQRLSKAMDPLLAGFLKLTEVGTRFLPRLGDAAEKVFTRFENFIDRVDGDGSLTKWIDQGLNSLTSLGNIGINIFSIVDKVAESFNKASGTEGGFLTSLENATGPNSKLVAFLNSGALVDYFKRANEFIGHIGKAINDMRPAFGEIVDTAREWSGYVFSVVGALTETATWIDRNTGLLKPLIAAYLSFKTLSPIVGGLTAAWKNYNTVVQAAAKHQILGDVPGIKRAADGMGVLTGKIPPYRQALIDAAEASKGVTTASDTAATATTALTSEQKKAATAFDQASARAAAMEKNVTNFVSPANAAKTAAANLGISTGELDRRLVGANEAARNATPAVTSVGDEAAKAGAKIGGGTVSMVGRVGALVGALAPGAALMIAIPLVMAAIDKLGEAHRNAARDAKAQDDALKGLSQTLNATTGAFTAQTLTDTLGKYKAGVPLGGGVNPDFKVLDAMSNLGLDARQETAIAANPAASGQFDQRQGARIAEIAKGIEASPVYQDNKANFDEYGLDPLTLAKASVGQDEAFAKVEAAKNNPKFTTNERGAQEQVRVPDLGALANSLPNQDLFGVSQVLQQTHDENVATGANSLAVSQIAGGKPQFTDQGAGFFSNYAPDVNSLTKDVAGAGIVQINKPLDQATIDYWRDGLGFTVGDPVPGTTTRAITIPAEKVDGWLTAAPGFADGGIVPGRGGPREDNIMIKASAGEHITQVPAVKHYGQKLFDDLNSMRIPRRGVGGFLGGGFKLDPALPSPTPPPVAPSGGGLGSLFLPPSVQAPQVGLPGPLAQLPSPLAPPAVTAPPVTPTAPAEASGGLPSGFRAIPDAGAPLPAEAGFTAPPTSLQNGLPYQPSMTGNGAFPDTKSSGASAVPGAPIIPGANILDYESYIGQQYGLSVGSQSDTNNGGTHDPDGGQHSMNRATDLGSSEQAKSGQISNFVKAWMADPAKVASTRQLIFQGPDGPYGIINGRILQGEELQSVYGGDLGGHTDHVHLALEGVPQDAVLPGGVPNDFLTNGAGSNGLAGLFGIGTNVPPGGLFETPGRLASQEFLKDTIVGVAGQAGQIGLEALGSFFGLDLSYLTSAKTAANFYLGKLGKSQTGDTASTDQAGALLGDYQGGVGYQGTQSNGQLNLGGSLTSGANSAWGALSGSALSQPGKKGGEAYRSLVRSIVKAQGPGMGIPPTGYKAWEDALVKQIDTESGGDPFSNNPNDDNGKGGKQSVSGLFNFLPTTFQSVVPGSNINDPSAQIVGAMRLVAKHGLSATGGPPSYPGTIGEGHGFYADGGMPGNGNAMVSAGEYRTNPKAVAHYGPGLYSMLNSMSLPKGFAEGGFPAGMVPPPKIPEIPQIALPKIAPPAAGGGQSAGPLPLAPPGAAGQPGLGGRANAGPSTGGAPGPGATAPAPDPGVLPSVVPDIQGSLAGIGTGVGGGGSATIQPGASPNTGPDARGTLGAAPASTDHVNPALKGAIKAGAQIAGNIGAAAASAGSFGMPMPGMSQMIQGAADIGGQVVGNVANVFSSLLVGTATGGSTASASGVPLLPARPPTQTGVAPINQSGRTHNGDNHYHLTNLDEYKRKQEMINAQESLPFIGKY